MNSIFDPDFQNKDVASKIVVALERLSQALQSNLWRENKRHSLSPIQIRILIFLSFQDESRRNITRMARAFNLSKPTISAAVRVLEQRGLVEKTIHPDDARSTILQLTGLGAEVAADSSHFANDIRTHVADLDTARQDTLLISLLDLIYKLQRDDVISLQRMCYSCRYFTEKADSGAPFYCEFMQKPLQDGNLRIDCPEHEPKS